MIPERYEHYKPPHNIHHLLLYGLAVGVIASIFILTIYVADIAREVRGVRTAQKNLNARFHVDYNAVTPPPAWMRK